MLTTASTPRSRGFVGALALLFLTIGTIGVLLKPDIAHSGGAIARSFAHSLRSRTVILAADEAPSAAYGRKTASATSGETASSSQSRSALPSQSAVPASATGSVSAAATGSPSAASTASPSVSPPITASATAVVGVSSTLPASPALARPSPIANVMSGSGCPPGTRVVLSPKDKLDGAGSQVLAQLNTFILSRMLAPDVGYLHHPLWRLDSMHPESAGVIERWKELVALPDIGAGGCVAPREGASYDAGPGCRVIDEASGARLEDISDRVKQACSGSAGPQTVVVRLDPFSYFHFDRKMGRSHYAPAAAVDFSAVLPWIRQPHNCGGDDSRPCVSDGSELFVAVHIRRGDIAADWGPGGPTKPHGRYVPNVYYVSMANALTRALADSGLPPPRFAFYMDRPAAREKEASLFLSDFDAVTAPHQILLSTDTIAAFQAMVRSDILFSSFSAFSISAGLLRDVDRGMVVCWPWELLYRPEWFVVDDTAPIDEQRYYTELMAYLSTPEHLKRLRSVIGAGFVAGSKNVTPAVSPPPSGRSSSSSPAVTTTPSNSPPPAPPSAQPSLSPAAAVAISATSSTTTVPSPFAALSVVLDGGKTLRVVTPATAQGFAESSGCGRPIAGQLQVERSPSQGDAAAPAAAARHAGCSAVQLFGAIGRGFRQGQDRPFIIPEASPAPGDSCASSAIHWFTSDEACDLMERVGYLYLDGDSVTRHLTQALWSVLAGDLNITDAFTSPGDEGYHHCTCDAAYDDGHEMDSEGHALHERPRNRYCRVNTISTRFGGTSIEGIRGHKPGLCPKWTSNHLCYQCGRNGLPAKGVYYLAGGLRVPLNEGGFQEVFGQSVPSPMASWRHLCGFMHSPDLSKKPVAYLVTHGHEATQAWNQWIFTRTCQRPGDRHFDAYTPTKNATSIDGQHYYQAPNLLLAQLLLNTLAAMDAEGS